MTQLDFYKSSTKTTDPSLVIEYLNMYIYNVCKY